MLTVSNLFNALNDIDPTVNKNNIKYSLMSAN